MSLVRACAGVALSGPLADAFAPLACPPLASAQVDEVTDLSRLVGEAASELMWSVDGGGVQWELRRWADDGFVFAVDGTPTLAIGTRDGSMVLGRHGSTIAAQLVAAVGAPALAVAHGALALHGSSMARDGAATVILGPSGSGKSSLLCALADRGWAPIAEDVTVLDVAADGRLRAWPGPPWVRLLHGQAGPRGSHRQADATDKARWDLQGRMPERPTTVGRIVVIAPAGAAGATLRPVDAGRAIAAIPPHVTWLAAGPRAQSAFSTAVTIARRTPVLRLSLPRAPEWLDGALALLSER